MNAVRVYILLPILLPGLNKKTKIKTLEENPIETFNFVCSDQKVFVVLKLMILKLNLFARATRTWHLRRRI